MAHDDCRAHSSPHHFVTGKAVVDPNGLRGRVADSSALYAVIRWEDGREEEVDQGEPRVTVDRDGNPFAGDFYFWSAAGPKPEEAPVVESPSTLPLPEAA